MTIVSEHDIEELRFSLKNRLGEALLLTSQEDMLRYCRDWHGDVTSSAVAVIRPRSTKEVSDTVSACAELGLSIIPQGGNTGLVLGGIPDAPKRQVVLSLERMNAIRTIDSDDFSASCSNIGLQLANAGNNKRSATDNEIEFHGVL